MDDDYEQRLRARISQVEQVTEAAYRELGTSTAHPLSQDYKSLQQTALITGGSLTGLLAALELLTGDASWEQDYTAKLKRWMGQA